MFRALKSFRSGDLTSTVGDFSSDQYAGECAEFADFINMIPALWDRVIEASKEYVPKGVRRSSSRNVAVVPRTVARAVLRGDSEDEADENV